MAGAMLIVVLVHAAVASWHGLAHLKVPVALSSVQTGFVAVVVMLAPLLGAGLGFTRFRVVGALVVCLAMAAAGVFGLLHHFVLQTPDNLTWLPMSAWTDQFVHSSFAILALEVLGTVIGALAWQRWSGTGVRMS